VNPTSTLATRGEWSALDGRTVEIGDVITTDRGDQATNVRLLPVENASTDGADAGVSEDAANEEPWAAGIRVHLERRGWTQGELASRSSLKPNTVGAVLRGDPTSTRTLTAIAAGFGVGVSALFDGGTSEPADHWTAALEHLDAAGRTLAAAKVDATPRPELTPDAAADIERATLAAHRALEAIGEAAAEVRVGRALSAFIRGAEPAESLGR
jgi:transcriptional regulator with XRE-family HTH domain